MGVRIQFRDSENKLDQEMASKVFEWCKTQYEDWFETAEDEQSAKEGEFYCSNGEINIAYHNGIFESKHPDECEDTDWLEEIYEEFKPYIMNAVVVQNEGNYYESPHSYIAMKVCESGGERKLAVIEDCGIDFGPEISTITSDEPESGGFLKDQLLPFGDLRVRIKNTKTGELKVLGRLDFIIKFDEDMNEYNDIYVSEHRLVDDKGFSVYDWQSIKGFENKEKALKEYDIDPAESVDWEFDAIIAENIFEAEGWCYPTA